MYRFNLQTVLNHRQYIEDNLTKELAECKQAVLAARKELETMQAKEINTAAALKAEQAQGLSSDQVVGYQVYLKQLAERITAQKAVIAKALQLEMAKQEELMAAMKKRQILEKLKEQGLERYNREMLKKEMAFIDEMAVNRFVGKASKRNGDDE